MNDPSTNKDEKNRLINDIMDQGQRQNLIVRHQQEPNVGLGLPLPDIGTMAEPERTTEKEEFIVQDCPICLQEMYSNQNLFTSKCNHQFH